MPGCAVCILGGASQVSLVFTHIFLSVGRNKECRCCGFGGERGTHYQQDRAKIKINQGNQTACARQLFIIGKPCSGLSAQF